MASSYKVSPGNIFGRIGQGFGQGLAQQIPEEIQRGRLQSGLQNLAENSEGLTPFQQFARLSSIPGATPQMIESGANLLRQQAQRNAYRNPISGEQIVSPQTNASLAPRQEVSFSPTRAGVGMAKEEQPKGVIPEGFTSREEQAKTGTPIVQENPLNPKFIPAQPWTQERRESEVSKILERDPSLTVNEAFQRASDIEARELERPRAEQERQEYLRKKQEEADAELDKQLEIALQKEGKSVYGDLTGDTLLDLKKAMSDDLATNPDLTVKQAAEKWRRNAKDFVEVKNIMKEKAARPFIDKISPQGKEDTLKSLKIAQKSYEKMGKSREFYNTLISDFGLSPGAAALVAYPRSAELKSSLKQEWGNLPISESATKSRQFAKDFIEKGTTKDSALAFAKSLKNKFPFFDHRAYNDYLQENAEKLTPDQKKEIQQGPMDKIGDWGDIALFPYIGRSVVDD